MEKIIESINKRIRLITQNEYKLENIVNYLIPNVRVIDSPNLYQFTLRFNKGKLDLIINPNEIIISSEEENSKDIVTASSRILEHLLFLNGQYSVHSSAFSIDDKIGILLPGHARTGKTTTMLNL